MSMDYMFLVYHLDFRGRPVPFHSVMEQPGGHANGLTAAKEPVMTECASGGR